MNFKDERNELIKYGKEMLRAKLTTGSGGNLSIFIRDKQLVAITPSGISYNEMQPEDIVILDLEGNIIEGDKKPSSEHSMHRIFYKKRQDINAIIHLHSVYSTTLACLHWELPATHYLIGVSGGENVRCAEYATYGTKELAENVYEAMEDRSAVFLANHGLITGAATLSSAFSKAEEIELCAEVYYRAMSIGKPKIIPTDEVEKMIGMFQGYGQRLTK